MYRITNHDHEYQCEECKFYYELDPSEYDTRFCSPRCREVWLGSRGMENEANNAKHRELKNIEYKVG